MKIIRCDRVIDERLESTSPFCGRLSSGQFSIRPIQLFTRQGVASRPIFVCFICAFLDSTLTTLTRCECTTQVTEGEKVKNPAHIESSRGRGGGAMSASVGDRGMANSGMANSRTVSSEPKRAHCDAVADTEVSDFSRPRTYALLRLPACQTI